MPGAVKESGAVKEVGETEAWDVDGGGSKECWRLSCVEVLN